MKSLPKTALVTGASSGIGAAIAKKFAAEGMRVVLTARREERLLEVRREIMKAGGQAHVIPADLTDETDRARLYVETCSLPVDVLVNNAGFGWYGYYTDMNWDTIHDLLAVNVEAAIHLTRLFLPGMQQRRKGHIINISSIAGSLPSQGTAMYCASKAFLDAFTTVIYRETRGTNVEISLVRPGPVKTEFFDTATSQRAALHAPLENTGVEAEVVARHIWRLLERPRRVLHIPGVVALAPLFEMATGWIQDLIGPVHLKNTAK